MCLVTNYIATTSSNKDRLLRSILFRFPQPEMLDKVKEFLEKNNFEIASVTTDFFEICAYKDYGEYTFSFLADGSRSTLNIYLYAPSKKYSKKKILRQITSEIRSEFKDYLE